MLAFPRTASLALSLAILLQFGLGALAGPMGPLKVHPTNGRYFTDGTTNKDGALKAVYLTGSHTWANLIDRGPADPPPNFDFHGYLEFLETNNHNFIRLWARHVSWYHNYGEGELWAAPLAWQRTGPGNALDGKPKFNLTLLNPDYFKRLKERVEAAQMKGIYASVMLFGGSYECKGGWQGNPFNKANNINKLDGDLDRDGVGLESHTLDIPAIVRIQEEYVRKVIDTLNDLDNVLYEISNEGDDSSKDWQFHFIEFIKRNQKGKKHQHPIGMTPLWTEAVTSKALANSEADWISPQVTAAQVLVIPPADGTKVSIVDSDHWFVGELYRSPQFGREWVWKTFCRGHNPILMEHLPPLSFKDTKYPVSLTDAGYIASRKAMGLTRRLANMVNLAAMRPRPELATSGYCLANPGIEYLIYTIGKEPELMVQLPKGRYEVQRINMMSGQVDKRDILQASGGESRIPGYNVEEGVFYLKRTHD